MKPRSPIDEAARPTAERKLSVAELLAARTKLPPGRGPLTQDDIDRAIAEGVAGGERAILERRVVSHAAAKRRLRRWLAH